jgi:hypothetical protein
MSGDSPLTSRNSANVAGIVVFDNDRSVICASSFFEFAALNLRILTILEDVDDKASTRIPADSHASLFHPLFQRFGVPLPVSFG